MSAALFFSFFCCCCCCCCRSLSIYQWNLPQVTDIYQLLYRLVCRFQLAFALRVSDPPINANRGSIHPDEKLVLVRIVGLLGPVEHATGMLWTTLLLMVIAALRTSIQGHGKLRNIVQPVCMSRWMWSVSSTKDTSISPPFFSVCVFCMT